MVFIGKTQEKIHIWISLVELQSCEIFRLRSHSRASSEILRLTGRMPSVADSFSRWWPDSTILPSLAGNFAPNIVFEYERMLSSAQCASSRTYQGRSAWTSNTHMLTGGQMASSGCRSAIRCKGTRSVLRLLRQGLHACLQGLDWARSLKIVLMAGLWRWRWEGRPAGSQGQELQKEVLGGGTWVR